MTPDEVLALARFTLGFWAVMCVLAAFVTAWISSCIYDRLGNGIDVEAGIFAGCTAFVLAIVAVVLIFFFARSYVVPASVPGYTEAVERLTPEKTQ